MALLEVTNLVAGYGKVEVISDVSFTLEPGKSIGIVGPNGSAASSSGKVLKLPAIVRPTP
jgi:ABC-type Mn2+/Zn2+ transport system ATPase subunit